MRRPKSPKELMMPTRGDRRRLAPELGHSPNLAIVTPAEIASTRHELLKEPMYALGQVLIAIHRLTPEQARICLARAEVLNSHRPLAKPQGKARSDLQTVKNKRA